MVPICGHSLLASSGQRWDHSNVSTKLSRKAGICGSFSWIMALVVCTIIYLPTTRGKITDASIRSDDRLLIPLDQPFGFSKGGHINITITNFALRSLYDPVSKKISSDPDLGGMGLMLTTSYGAVLMDEEAGERGICPLDSDEEITLFRFSDMDTNLEHPMLERHFVLDDILEDFKGGEFVLYFANCDAYTAVDFDVRLALYNVKGNRADYLPVGQDVLPPIYFFSFILFSALLVVWIGLLLKAREGTQKIHWAMALLVLLKALTVLSQSGMYHMIAIHGHPDGWNVAFYLFTAIRSVLFFTMIILIAAGWSYMRPFLGEKEKHILLLVVPLQVIANVAIVVTDELTPASPTWFSWRDIWHIVDILCCCAVLFPVVWAIRQMRETAEEDGKMARALAKLVLFRQFYVITFSYIYFTRIIAYLLEVTLPYQHIWWSPLSTETATLAYYVACGWLFRPMAAGVNPYFALEGEELEMARHSL